MLVSSKVQRCLFFPGETISSNGSAMRSIQGRVPFLRRCNMDIALNLTLCTPRRNEGNIMSYLPNKLDQATRVK